MMMQILDAGGLEALTDRVRAADEGNPRGYFELEAVKETRNDASWVNGASGKCVKVIFLLLSALPPGHHYKVIFMRRNVTSVVASQQALLARMGKAASGLPPDKLAQVYVAEVDKISLWITEQTNIDVLWVDYEAVIEGAEDVVAEVAEFLGGGFNLDAMRSAVDPQLRHHRA